MSDWTTIKVARRAFLTLALFVIVGVAAGPCYNLVQGACGTYQEIGTITCQRLVQDPQNPDQQMWQACATVPLVIIWPAVQDRCAEATSPGNFYCDSDGGTEVHAVRCTYECIPGQCSVQLVGGCVNHQTCKNAVLTGNECDP
jgi:hypothetical protein